MKDLMAIAANLPVKKRRGKLAGLEEVIYLLYYYKDYSCQDIVKFLAEPDHAGITVDPSSIWDVLNNDPDRDRRRESARLRKATLVGQENLQRGLSEPAPIAPVSIPGSSLLSAVATDDPSSVSPESKIRRRQNRRPVYKPTPSLPPALTPEQTRINMVIDDD